jgi:threonine dehydratase
MGGPEPDRPTLVTQEQVREATARVRPHLHRTPMLTSRTLSERAGAPVLLKAELLQRTGSFKPRGGLNEVLQLTPEQARRGVITISAGNHAQGVAYAARIAGVAATVVMPATAAASKVAAARGYGAEVVLSGDVHQAFATLDRLRAERDLHYIHPFDSPRMVAGHGSLGLEILEDAPGVGLVVVPVGGGGLIAGVAAALAGSGSRVVGVEPEGAPGMVRALAAGRPVRLDAVDTIADGLAPPFVGVLNLEHVRRQVEDVVLVGDEEIRAGMWFLMERCKLMAEPSGAAAVAVLLAGRVTPPPGRTVVAVVSGGNLDLERLGSLLPPR